MRLDHAGILVISADWFYRLMTLHGAGMIAAILWPRWAACVPC